MKEKEPLKITKVTIATEIPLEEREQLLFQVFDILLSGRSSKPKSENQVDLKPIKNDNY